MRWGRSAPIKRKQEVRGAARTQQHLSKSQNGGSKGEEGSPSFLLSTKFLRKGGAVATKKGTVVEVKIHSIVTGKKMRGGSEMTHGGAKG